MEIRIDCERLLADLPFPARELPLRLYDAGITNPIGQRAIDAWRLRGRINCDRLAELLYVSALNGRRLDLNQYLVVSGVANAA